MGKMIFTIASAFAEFELNLLRERVKAGLVNARAKGKTLGRPSAKVDREEFLQLRSQGLSIREIGVRLQVDKMVVQKNLREIFPVCKTPKNPRQISL